MKKERKGPLATLGFLGWLMNEVVLFTRIGQKVEKQVWKKR